MKNKSKLLIACLSILSAVALLSGTVYAAWAVTDNADNLEVTIRLDTPAHNVTFHTPNASDSTCMGYSTTVSQAEYGDTLSDITVPSTSSFLGFSFGGWYLDSAFTQAFSSSTAITTNIDLYAKYTRSNVLFDGNSTYFVSGNSDQTVDSRYIYRVSSQTWGIVPTKSDSNKVDLLSASGIYKMTYANSNWTILRKVGFNAKDTTWWGDANYITYAYGQPEDRNSWDNVYWDGQLSTTSAYVSGSQTGTVYIDYSYNYIGCGRYPSGTSISGKIDGNKRPTNHTYHISLDNGYGYAKDRIYLYIYGNGDVKNVGWGA